MPDDPAFSIELSTDCRHFRFDRPCAPHKREGVSCPRCSHYDRIERRICIVKLAATGKYLALYTVVAQTLYRSTFPTTCCLKS